MKRHRHGEEIHRTLWRVLKPCSAKLNRSNRLLLAQQVVENANAVQGRTR